MSQEREQDDINIIVMSEAGKPIFSSWRNEEELTKTCGLISALRTSLVDDTSLGDIQSFRSNTLTVVFMTVSYMTLIAASKSGETEAYLKMLLEHVYSQLIFTLTSNVQNIFNQNPSFDLRSILGPTDNALLGSFVGSFENFTGAVETVFPISPIVREEASQALQHVGNKTENTVYAILMSNNKLLTLVQPNYRPHQLRTSDLRLILNFVKHQPGLLTSELWFPVCLPRFNSSGFLYAYTNCLHKDTNLILILISQHNTTEQFECFRSAATSLRRELGLPAVLGSVLRILEGEKENDDSTHSDIAWKRSDEKVDKHESDDEDYVDASGDGDNMIPSVTKSENFVAFKLVQELQNVTDEAQESLIEEYCSVASAIHFVFRIDVSVKRTNPQTSNGVGTLTQCIMPPVGFPFVDTASKRRVWNMYQKLHLRLRLGSASAEASMDAFDMIAHDNLKNGEEKGPKSNFDGIGKDLPAICLAESPPNEHGVTFVSENELFIGLNGRGFELYAVLPHTIPAAEGAKLCAKLVRALMLDERRLFLAFPLTWK